MRFNPDPSGDILAAIAQAQFAEQTALQQLSSGKRVNRPSDDPAAAAGLIQNHAASATDDRYLQSVSSIRSLLQTADSSLSSVTSSLQRAITLGVEGANGTESQANRVELAQELSGIRDQIFQIANLSYQGTYVFGGTATTNPPFVKDSTDPSGVRYVGNNNVNMVAIGPSEQAQMNVPGRQLFSATGNSIFQNLQNLITSLNNGDTTAISDATVQLRSSLDYFSQQRVMFGNTVNQLDAQEQFLNQDKVQLSSLENSLVAANLDQAATNLSQAQTAHNAALAAAAKVLPVSLLDYLR
jgi:flagellar hook-associated protein 3 FlgL